MAEKRPFIVSIRESTVYYVRESAFSAKITPRKPHSSPCPCDEFAIIGLSASCSRRRALFFSFLPRCTTGKIPAERKRWLRRAPHFSHVSRLICHKHGNSVRLSLRGNIVLRGQGAGIFPVERRSRIVVVFRLTDWLISVRARNAEKLRVK